MKKIAILLSFAILSLIFLGTIRVPVAPAATTAILFISPENRPLVPTGSTVSLSVNFSSFPTLNGFDIQVKDDQTVLNPKSIDFNGAAAPTLLVTVNCINGGGGIPAGSPGNIGCTTSDGHGVAHAAAALNGSPSGSGLLFNVNFTAVSSPNSLVALINDQVSDPAGHAIAHNSVPGVYGVPPSIGIFATHPQSVPAGSSGGCYVVLTSLPSVGDVRFSGVPNIIASSNTPGVSAAFPTPTTQVLTAGGSIVYELTISVAGTVMVTSATITLSTSGKDVTTSIVATNSTSVTVTITAPTGPSGGNSGGGHRWVM